MKVLLMLYPKLLVDVSLFAMLLIACHTPCTAQEAPTEIRLPITLEGDQRTELRARIEGYVEKVHVDIGDNVVRGQTLVTLDAPELQAEVVRKQQIVRQAEAQLQVANSAVETAEARLLQAESALDEQVALTKLRTIQRDRYTALVRGGAVETEKLDEASYALMAVEAVFKKTEADIAAAVADVSAAKSEVEFARSGIEVTKAELAYAKAQDAMRTIVAPFNGLITARNVDPGTLVNSGSMNSKPLLVVENIEVMRGIMTVPAKEARLISIGSNVSFVGFGEVALKAPDGENPRVSRISQSLEMATKTMRVEIDLANPLNKKIGRYQLLSGQYGSATIQIKQ